MESRLYCRLQERNFQSIRFYLLDGRLILGQNSSHLWNLENMKRLEEEVMHLLWDQLIIQVEIRY